MHFCFTLNGKKICIRIPVLIDRRWRIPDPDPGPIREWVEVDGDPGWRGDLVVLASVAALARLSESETVQRALLETVRDQAEQLRAELPEGAELNFEKVEG